MSPDHIWPVASCRLPLGTVIGFVLFSFFFWIARQVQQSTNRQTLLTATCIFGPSAPAPRLPSTRFPFFRRRQRPNLIAARQNTFRRVPASLFFQPFNLIAANVKRERRGEKKRLRRSVLLAVSLNSSKIKQYHRGSGPPVTGDKMLVKKEG